MRDVPVANHGPFPLVIFSHPRVGSIASHFFVPGVQGGVSSNAVLLIIAIVGTTVARAIEAGAPFLGPDLPMTRSHRGVA